MSDPIRRPFLDFATLWIDGRELPVGLHRAYSPWLEERLEPDRDADLPHHEPRRTRRTHPYNYDPFTIWGAPRADPSCNHTVYVDRLEGLDPAKYARLSREHFRSGSNDYERPFDANNCRGHLIEHFLRTWFEDEKLRLLRVVEYCHPGTGERTHRLDFVTTRPDA